MSRNGFGIRFRTGAVTVRGRVSGFYPLLNFLLGGDFGEFVPQVCPFGCGRPAILLVVGCMLLVTAALLAFAYYAKPRQKAQLSYRDAFLIGVAQAVAALPGLSRSGSTIATGLLLGNRKQTVAQFSFLMVLAPILGETFLELMKGNLGAQAIGSAPLAAGFVAAFVVGCLACKFMIEIVKRGKLVWFALYCAAAGTVSILSYVL